MFIGFVGRLWFGLWWSEPFHTQKLGLQDVKPANILLDESGAAFVTGFSVSRMLEGMHPDFTGAAGTVNYMAPEMFNEADQPTLATDVWAAGCAVVEMLTGKGPFHGLPFQVSGCCFSIM